MGSRTLALITYDQNGYIEITPSSSTPALYIICEEHPNMGGALTIMEGDDYSMGDGSYADDGGPMDGFLIGYGDAGEVFLYTPDDQVAVTVTGITELAEDILAEDDTILNIEDAKTEALDRFVMEFFSDDHAMDDHANHDEIV